MERFIKNSELSIDAIKARDTTSAQQLFKASEYSPLSLEDLERKIEVLKRLHHVQKTTDEESLMDARMSVIENIELVRPLLRAEEIKQHKAGSISVAEKLGISWLVASK